MGGVRRDEDARRGGHGSLDLRNHAEQILQAVALDIAQPQTAHDQKQKSLGRAPVFAEAPETAAQSHAVLRARSGFDINQLAAEYRALRASVLRLWDDAYPGEPRHLEDVIRFNEAIDQALCESIGFYSAEVERARNLLLGMLGHDMRNPLNTIQLTASYLRHLNAGEEVSAASQRLINSGSQMQALLDDLVDFNRTKLGLGIRVSPAKVDLAQSFATEIEQLRFAHPGHAIELQVEGDVSGDWDERRLQQVLANLVVNAMKYGNPGAPVRVSVTGEANSVNIEVFNLGVMVAPEGVDSLFEPLRRGIGPGDPHQASSLGLGLFIAREIARAHGGQIRVIPHVAATVFEVNLPRVPAPAAP